MLLLGLVFAVPPVADGTLDVIDELELGDVLEAGHQTVLDTHETLPEGLKSVRDLGRDALKHGALDEVPGAPLVPGQHLTEDADGVHEDVVDVAEQAEPAFLDDLAVREFFLVRADEALPDATEEVGLLLADDLAGLFVDLYVVAEEVRPDGLAGGLDAVSKPRGRLTDGPACLLRHFPHLAGGLDDGVPVLDHGANRRSDACTHSRADARNDGADRGAHAAVLQHRPAGLHGGLGGAVFHTVSGVFDDGATEAGYGTDTDTLEGTALEHLAGTAGHTADSLAGALEQAGAALEQAAKCRDELALREESHEGADPAEEHREERHHPGPELAEARADTAEVLAGLLAGREEAGLPLRFLQRGHRLGRALANCPEATLHLAGQLTSLLPQGCCPGLQTIGDGRKLAATALHGFRGGAERRRHAILDALHGTPDGQATPGDALGDLRREEAEAGAEQSTSPSHGADSGTRRHPHDSATAHGGLSRSPRAGAAFCPGQVAANHVHGGQLAGASGLAAPGDGIQSRADGVKRDPRQASHDVFGHFRGRHEHLAADLDQGRSQLAGDLGSAGSQSGPGLQDAHGGAGQRPRDVRDRLSDGRYHGADSLGRLLDHRRRDLDRGGQSAHQSVFQDADHRPDCLGDARDGRGRHREALAEQLDRDHDNVLDGLEEAFTDTLDVVEGSGNDVLEEPDWVRDHAL